MIKIWIVFILLFTFNIITYSDDLITSILAQIEHPVIIVKGAYDINNTEFFEPSQILIKPNDTIKWINNDTIVHTVTSIITFGKSDVFDSGYLNKNDDFKYTFYRNGIFDYYCKVHPFSVGKVIDKF